MSTVAPELDVLGALEAKVHDPLLYTMYEASRFAQISANLPVKIGALAWESMAAFNPWIPDIAHRFVKATEELSDRAAFEYTDPGFKITSTIIDGKEVKVNEKLVESQQFAFGSLVHMEAETDLKRPPVLLVVPYSGHYASYLKETAERLLLDFDVYITRWGNARDIPKSAGEFGMEGYVTNLISFIKHIGPDVNVISVCQATVPGLMAEAYIAQTEPELQPLSTTLIAGPIDVGAAPSAITDYANSMTVEQVCRSSLAMVPDKYRGAERIVKPGFLQLASFIAMDPMSHIYSEQDIFRHRVMGNDKEAERLKKFRRNYYAVLDMEGRFFLETFKYVFQDRALALGTMTYNGTVIDLDAMDNSHVLLIEGEDDLISPPGHTAAARLLLTGIDPNRITHHSQPGVGHTGAFRGRKFRDVIAHKIKDNVRDALAAKGLADKYYLPAA